MLNMYLMSLLDESVETDDKGLVVYPINESIFSNIKRVKDNFVNKIMSRHDKDYTTTIDDFNAFLTSTRALRIMMAKKDMAFAKTTISHIEKYKNCDNDNDVFGPEITKHNDEIYAAIKKRNDALTTTMKGDWGKIVSKEFIAYLSRNPSELKRFTTLQDRCRKMETEIGNICYDVIDVHNKYARDLMRNGTKYTSYQVAVINWCLGDLKDGALFSLNDLRDILGTVITIDVKSIKNESAILTEAAKDEDADDTDGGDDDTSAESENSGDTNTDDNADDSNNDDDTNSDDENQDDNDNNDDDENKDDNSDDDSSSDDDFSMDSDDPSSEDDGENPDGLASPDATGEDESTQDTETNVHVNILNLSKLDRTISLKRLLNDYTATRTSINTFLNIIDKNETVIDATLRESLVNDLNSLQQNLTDYIGIKFSYINYEENLQNYIIFSKKLEDIVQRLQSAMQHNDK